MLAGAILAACSDDEDSTPPTTAAPSITTTTIASRPDDQILTVGLLLPISGDGAGIGQTMADGARRAIGEINVAGGVAGRNVVLVVEDEGETAAEATDAITALVDSDVDVVIGPASSTTSLATLDLLVAADVLTCSPSATALALDEFPDDDLFLRTAPSDSLQAVGMAQLVDQTGKTSVAVTWLDDVYGRPLASIVSDDLRARAEPIDVVAEVPFTADDDLTGLADDIAQESPGVVVVVADSDQGTRMLAALDIALSEFPEWETPDVVVNDAMRIPPSPQSISELSTALRREIQGLSPVVASDSDLNGAFATNAYDCVNLVAIAASIAGPDDPSAMAEEISEISARGELCRTFVDCTTSLAEGRNIDYEGPAGPVEIGADGDPQRARYTLFRFDSEGLDVTVNTFPVPV